jgi:alpha-glucosidase
VHDPWEKNEPGLGLGRDPERTPMQWDGAPGGGFTTGTPWLPLAADYRVRNVAAQAADPASMLTLYRRLIALRRAEPALAIGSYRAVAGPPDVLVYIREHAGRRLLVALNLGDAAERIDLPTGRPGRLLLSTDPARREQAADARIDLAPAEGIVVALSDESIRSS